MENLETRIELQSNIARTLCEKWIIEGCKKPLKLKFHYGTVVCKYKGDSKFEFIARSGFGNGKDLESFNSLSDVINKIAIQNGWLGNKDVYKL
jgi:hypothetical protein